MSSRPTVLTDPAELFRVAFKAVRKEAGLSQIDISEKSPPPGMSQALVSAIERGFRDGSEAARRRMAASVGWEYEALLALGQRIIDESLAAEKQA